jgi:hypothetical protein
MAERSKPEDREGPLSDLMLSLLNDNYKQVKKAAYKNLGKFIYLLKGLKINEGLIKEFCLMPTKNLNPKSREPDNEIDCAYNFPAVTEVLGPSRWPDLYKAYEKLLKSNNISVKVAMSEGLHEIAKIIKEENTEKYLFKAIDQFFKEKSTPR